VCVSGRRFRTHYRFHLHRQVHSPAYEDGTDSEFRNVGQKHTDGGNLPKRKQTILGTWRKLKINNNNMLLHYYPRHVSGVNITNFRRKDCIQTASGIFALCKRLHTTQVESVYRERRYQMLSEYNLSS
jgi:hypothetical protein